MIKSQWGIAIDITCEVTSFGKYQNKNLCKKIIDNVWIRFLLSLDFDEEKYIINGLLKVADLINQKSPYKNDTLIIFHEITYNPCDYQAEGLTAAIYQWVVDVFKIDMPEYSVSFNRSSNKYEFNYRQDDI